jgi:L-alanine-DL-glutamate epimerase-like enolase superfamily enzyme
LSGPLRVRELRALLYRCPLASPVRTSFGEMRERSAVFVGIEDEDGVTGWGEVWCNFPECAAEHRAQLLRKLFAPLLAGRRYDAPADAFAALSHATAVLALQAGEPGPFAQCLAGIDIALWDLSARRAGWPLWRLLGGTNAEVRVYASGINPDAPERTALEQLARGHRAFKLKVGFGARRDLANLHALREALGAQALMADAHPAWSPAAAAALLPSLEAFDLHWLEEPIRADAPWEHWASLARATRIPLAAGENLLGEAAFAQALSLGALGVVQPDVAKWGGLTGCLPLARRVIDAGRLFCPHSLGGGIALLASAHLLAAAGGAGMLEVDVNPNPLRTALCGPLAKVREGICTLSEAPGLGIEPDFAALERTRDMHSLRL